MNSLKEQLLWWSSLVSVLAMQNRISSEVAPAAEFADWIGIPQQRHPERLRLFCFPYAGGGAAMYYTWAAELPSVEVCPIQLPGRESRIREPALSRMSLLVDALSIALRPYLGSPFAFCGHSMGALISFELARRLIRDGQPGPKHLFIAARRAPQLRDDRPSLHTQDEPAFVEQVSIRYGPLPKVIAHDPELMRLFMPTLRADLAVCETYEYQNDDPLDCPISVFGGWEDNGVSRSDLDAWRVQTTARFSLRMFAGDHFFIKSAKAALLRAIRDDLTWINVGASCPSQKT
jgi:medium-chain acyl-[acyl-carrier-protein] hydrolase